MKTFLLCLYLSGALIHADDITTLDGKTYHSAKVVKTEPDGITVLYSDGGAKILFTNLASDLQKKYGYDPAKAVAFTSAQQASDEAQKKEHETRAAALRNAVSIAGRVISKFPDGALLVQCDRPEITPIPVDDDSAMGARLPGVNYSLAAIGESRPANSVFGLLVLQNDPGSATLADGDMVKLTAYPLGLYTDSGATYHSYSAKLP